MLAAITIIFVGNIAQISGQWVITKTLLSMAGQTKEASFIYAVTATGNGWDVLLYNICSVLISALADGLLVRMTFLICTSFLITSPTDMAMLQCLG